MKRNLLTAVAGIVTLAVTQLGAATYNDTIGDLGGGATETILDITSVEVNNTATTLTFKINLSGNPTATEWGKYLIGIDSAPGGDPTGNGWGRPIGMSLPTGMDYFVGSWVDSGNGAEIRNWTGAWNLQSATYNPNPDSLSIIKDTSSVTIQFAFAGLGLSVGNSFAFDVFSSGGGGSDSAMDALANPGVTVAGWSDPYNSGSLTRSFTLVPEPGTLTVLGLGCMALIGRRIYRRN